jgi:hypothetical protein
MLGYSCAAKQLTAFQGLCSMQLFQEAWRSPTTSAVTNWNYAIAMPVSVLCFV